MSGAARVRCTVDGGVADVRLDRPEKLNAIDDEMLVELVATSTALRARDDVRAVVLSGNGRGFCAGLDRSRFRAMADGQAYRPPDADEAARRAAGPGADPTLGRGQYATLGFANLPVPVIAAVHGPALGGGLQLALAAHVRFVAADVSLGMLEVTWGMAPDMAGTQLLPRLVGADVAAEMILSGRKVDGSEAVRIGLATRVEADPLAAATALARRIASMNPDAVRASMRLLSAGSFAEGLALERVARDTLIGSPNQREAAAAALHGRAPVFTDPTG